MNRVTLSSLVGLAAVLSGCAAAPPPAPVRLVDLAGAKLKQGEPLLIELHAGDKLPLDMKIEGQYVRTDPKAASVRLEIVRDVFLLIDEDGIRSSFDGKTFGDHVAPGSFSFGLGATRERGGFASIVIRPPTLAEPR